MKRWFLLGAAVLAGPAGGADDAPAPAPSPSPRIEVHALVDAAFALNGNRPLDATNFFAGVGTVGHRDRELALTLGQVEVVVDPSPVGLHLTLGAGSSAEVVHQGEPSGNGTGPDVWRNVLQASAGWKTGLGRGLLLEAGIMPSHVGMESLQTRDGWNYTHSWLGELSPYYQTGVKASCPFSDHWSAQLYLLNGWQLISDNNRAKTLGSQVAYGADRFSFSLNTLAGREQPGEAGGTRVLGDVVSTWKPKPWLSLGVSVDVAREGRDDGSTAHWNGVALYARLAPGSGRTALALRAERFDDGDAGISGIAQVLKEVTVTLEHRPSPALSLKAEGRYDRSTADVFATDQILEGGGLVHGDHQLLGIVGVVASF